MDIDISKENIQPLRGGRNLTQLGTALQAQSDTDAQRQLQLQREEHEAAIRQYEGPDPLDPWFNYIQWVEQCYPKHGHEGHMDKLIKDCLQQFEKDERYYQDRRLVKLWIKYIDCLSNPLEIYQRLYNSGIGVQCSEFYRAWACYCEESGDYKKANQVYVLGMQAQAQPIDELEQAHMNFQLFFAQRMLHDDSPTKRKAASALAETRLALTSLKSFKRRNIAAAPVQRVGDSVRSFAPGTVRQGPVDRPTSNVMLTVYEDGPAASQPLAPVAADPGPASLVGGCSTNRENEKEVGVWTLPKTQMVHTNLVPHQPPPFIPYEDSDDVLRLSSKHLPHCVDDLTFTVPLYVPDPPDPTKISHYNKSEVYVGDKEYSFEEIKSRKYILNKIKTESPQNLVYSNHNYSQNINETLAQCSALETLANCALDPGQDHLQLMNLSIPALQNITKVTNMHSPGEPKVLQNLDSKEFSDIAAKRDENQRPKEADKENAASNMNPSFGNENFPPSYKNNLMEEFNRSLLGNLMSDSVTVNTKEARWELRNIFNDNEPTLVQPLPVAPFSAQPFAIHEDRSLSAALVEQRGPGPAPAGTPSRPARPPPLSHPPPDDKENAVAAGASAAGPMANKTAYYEEPSCTQVFNFNIKDASTPNASHFKRPLDQGRYPSVPKFSMDDSGAGMEQPEPLKPPPAAGAGSSGSGAAAGPLPPGPAAGAAAGPEPGAAGLSVIMEATREYNSKSGSTSSSGQSTRTNFTGYTTNYDSMYNHEIPTSSKRSSLSQPRLANGQFARAQPTLKQPDKPAAFLSHDHQYQKPAYNGYSNSPQRMHNQYQQNYSYQQYGHQHQMSAGYASPQGYHPPSPHVPPPQPQGFASPPYAPVGYPSPTHAMSPQPQPQPQPYHYQQERQHVYANQQFQSPPHQPQYPNQFYQRTNQYNVNQTYQLQPNYSNANVYASPQGHNQSQSHHSYAQSPYRQVPKVENVATCGQNQPFQVYQSPQNSFRSQNVEEVKPTTPTAKVDPSENMNKSVQKSQVPHKSPTAALRNIRHDLPKQSPDVGFSNQFINFISNRNEPKDTANTPKFTNSPNISHKMHKNLYVSSPEQAQIPPSSGMSDTDSKDGMTAQTLTPIRSANVTPVIDKQKDVSKRQLDFEQRAELQSEDSRDSVSKESRISSVYSRQSDFQSDGYGMDVDSENSMECGLFKSTHSISLVETSDIPRPADIDFPKQIDPFNKKLLASLLEYVKFPNKTHAEGYVEVRSVPKIQLASVVGVGNNRFSIEKQLGKGNYGAVFLCLDLHSNKSVAVKYQKPSRPWEFYICQEIKARIKDPFMLPGYMDITTAFIGENASLFVSEYSKYGSLLDVANKVRVATSKCINESIVILLASEMLSIVHYLHKAQIIHADIKPDNFLLMQIPTQEWRTPSLQLIDLGCAIDMSLFPERTSFRELIATEGFTCTEMRSGKPWTYQTDLYCLAGTIHVVLMGCYMKVTSRHGQWNIDKKLPRYMKVSLWDKIFTTLLNVPDCTNLPDLLELKSEVDNVLMQMDNLGSQLRSFDNVLKSR